jgi:pyruvate dehydrogenase E2 component (dihydrolipoamide acetyltransferase)
MPLERELPADLPLIRIDMPSHGNSRRFNVNEFRALARCVTQAFDRAVDGPVHILGHSLGGAVALALADVRPRQIASLTLIAPAGLGPEIDYDALMGIARASQTESLAPWLKRLTAKPDGISWDFARAAMLARNDPDLRSAQVELARTLFPDGVQPFDLTAALQRVVAPTSIIWGRSDHIVPWRHALAARGEMALHLLQEIGHIPHVECPAVVAGVLSRTMRQHQRREPPGDNLS